MTLAQETSSAMVERYGFRYSNTLSDGSIVYYRQPSPHLHNYAHIEPDGSIGGMSAEQWEEFQQQKGQ